MVTRTLDELHIDIDNNTPWPWMPGKAQFTCPYQHYKLLNEDTGEVVDFDCKSWKCSLHAPRQLYRWKTRVSMVPWQLFLTLTLVPEDKVQAGKAWTEYIRVLKRDFGVSTYLRTLELGQKGGLRHYHVLLHGASYIDANTLRALSERVGFGRRTNIKRVTDKAGAVHYVTKALNYCLKEIGLEDPRLKSWRRVTVSRNLPNWPNTVAKLYPLEKVEKDPDARWLLTRLLGRKANGKI